MKSLFIIPTLKLESQAPPTGRLELQKTLGTEREQVRVTVSPANTLEEGEEVREIVTLSVYWKEEKVLTQLRGIQRHLMHTHESVWCSS